MASQTPRSPTAPPSSGLSTPGAASAPLAPPRASRSRSSKSIFSGLLLIIIGALLLVDRLMPGVNLGYWITHYWPVILILWGAVKLIDRLSCDEPNHVGAPVPRPALLTGGEFALIAVLALAVGAVLVRGWLHGFLPRAVMDLSPFTERYTQTRRVTSESIPPRSRIAVTTTYGDLKIRASSSDQMVAIATESSKGSSEASARVDLSNITVVSDRTADGYSVYPVNAARHGDAGDVTVDLDVEVPKNVAVVAKTQHGDIRIADVGGNAETSIGTGDLNIRNTGGDVIADSGTGNTEIVGAGGSVHLMGHGAGDIEVTNVRGDAALAGNLFGDVTIRNVTKAVRYTSPHTTLSLAALPGELTLDPGDIEISHAAGPVVIASRDQDVKATDIDGRFDLSAEHGDIEVSYSNAPSGAINLTADSGNVTLSLPARSNFTISATSKSGDVENDFAAPLHHGEGEEGTHSINATYGSGGPAIHITTDYGSIHLRKKD